MNQQQHQISQQQIHALNQQRTYCLPDFTQTPDTLIRRLTGLDIDCQKLASELELRSYANSEIAFVILREAMMVMRDEHQGMVDTCNACNPMQLFQSMAGLRDRLTLRINARLQQVIETRLCAVPVWAVDQRKIIQLSDTLLASKGYIVEACKTNTMQVEVQVDVKQTVLKPGESFKVAHGTTINVSGAGQTIRWQRIKAVEQSGTLTNAIVLPAKLATVQPLVQQPKRPLLSRIFRRRK